MLRSTLVKLRRDPAFYIQRELGSLRSLLPSFERQNPTTEPLVWLEGELARLALGVHDTTHLLSVVALPELLRLLKDAADAGHITAFLVPTSKPPLDCAATSILTLFRAASASHAASVWVRSAREARSYVLELYEHPRGLYRARSPKAFLSAFHEVNHASLKASLGRLTEESDFFFHEPVDFVFTWVNGADPGWRELLRRYQPDSEIDWDRYAESGELRYALRSVFFNAPWLRKLYVVSNCSPPNWLELGERVVWVDHTDIIDSRHLPTFNSHVIEAALWEISGLSEHFVYMNDDMFLGEPCEKSTFFTSNGASLSYLEAFGSVDGYVPATIPASMPWQHAAVNGAKLVFERFGKRPNQHHRHVPYALKRSVARRMVADFSVHFEQLRNNRFRDASDISPTSFLYHHYAYHLREAVRAQCHSLLVQRRNYRSLGARLLTGDTGQFFCLNDGADSYRDESFQRFKKTIMERLFPLAAPWEKPRA